MGFTSQFENPYQTGGLQHLFTRHIRDAVGEDVFRNYFKFSFVRNPWDKAVSQFSYMQRRRDLQAYIGMKKRDSFVRYLELIQKKTHVQWNLQYEFLHDVNGNLEVDFLGRYERYEEDVREATARLGLNTETIPHERKTPHRPYDEYYDKETREIVGALYQKDIQTFQYTFRNESSDE